MRGGPIEAPRFDRSPHTVRGSYKPLAAPTVVRVLRSPGLNRLAGVAGSCPVWSEPGWRVRSKLGILRFRPAEDSSLLGPPGHWRPSTALTNGERHRRSQSSGNAGLSHCGKRIARSAWPVPMLQAACVPPVSGHASSQNACPGGIRSIAWLARTNRERTIDKLWSGKKAWRARPSACGM